MKTKSDFVNAIQGLFIVVFGIIGAVLGLPIWIVGIVATMVPLMMCIVVFALREKNKKGLIREITEVVIYLGTFVATCVLAANHVFSLTESSKWWMMFFGFPTALINLGIYIAWIIYQIELLFKLLRSGLEFCSGRKINAGGAL